ncbi:DUF6249 domain-containing protein [Thalassotalea sp. PS06]|uniref:DUF6249 domain-containing protein n=1 Tax=Thalassotalea sp. PS06 TaxID=2594005 RepID=UPI001164EB08|nr:DUF6249 domain-containing protein [Thalassotalea sp. PS06]QDP00454.1 hypothetical protein FNC98_03255 [Thalassotalea sp. PS06]
MQDGIIVGIIFFSFAAVAFSFLYFAYRNKMALQETIRLAMEKGQNLSPESIEQILQSQAAPQKDFKRGILLVSLAVAIGLFGMLEGFDTTIIGLSLFPLALGAGYLLVWKFDQQAS